MEIHLGSVIDIRNDLKYSNSTIRLVSKYLIRLYGILKLKSTPSMQKLLPKNFEHYFGIFAEVNSLFQYSEPARFLDFNRVYKMDLKPRLTQ